MTSYINSRFKKKVLFIIKQDLTSSLCCADSKSNGRHLTFDAAFLLQCMKFKIFHRTSIESILSQGIPEVYSDPPWRVPPTIVQQAEVNQLLEQSMCAQVGIAWNCIVKYWIV